MSKLGSLKVVSRKPEESPAEATPQSAAAGATVIAAIQHVYKHVGPGLSADVYKKFVAAEIEKRGLPVALDTLFDVDCSDVTAARALCVDILADGVIPVFIRAEHENPVHRDFLRAALMHTGKPEGFIANFHVADASRYLIQARVKKSNMALDINDGLKAAVN